MKYDIESAHNLGISERQLRNLCILAVGIRDFYITKTRELPPRVSVLWDQSNYCTIQRPDEVMARAKVPFAVPFPEESLIPGGVCCLCLAGHGPLVGLLPLATEVESWPRYCSRVFGIHDEPDQGLAPEIFYMLRFVWHWLFGSGHRSDAGFAILRLAYWLCVGTDGVESGVVRGKVRSSSAEVCDLRQWRDNIPPEPGEEGTHPREPVPFTYDDIPWAAIETWAADTSIE